MADTEAVRLCAEAMGYLFDCDRDAAIIYVCPRNGPESRTRYDPITNGEQCLALVERFWLACGNGDGKWYVRGDSNDEVEDTNLRRAVVHCVAKAQAAKAAK